MATVCLTIVVSLWSLSYREMIIDWKYHGVNNKAFLMESKFCFFTKHFHEDPLACPLLENVQGEFMQSCWYQYAVKVL